MAGTRTATPNSFALLATVLLLFLSHLAIAPRVEAIGPDGAGPIGADSRAHSTSGINARATANLLAPLGSDGLGLVDKGAAAWHLRAADGDPTVFTFGGAGDVPLMGDWNGDGVDTPGIYRASDGHVLLRNSNTAGAAESDTAYSWPTDAIPIAGDWNNNGTDTVSYYQPSTGKFFIYNVAGGSPVAEFEFGPSNGQPFAGDWDGDGTDTVGVRNGTTMSFRDSLTAGEPNIVFDSGQSGDLPLVGDWDGNEIDTFGLYRPGTISVFIFNSNAAGNPHNSFTWGDTPWVPVTGDFGSLTSGVTLTKDPSSADPPGRLIYAVESLYLDLPAAPSLPAGLRANLAGLPTGPKTTAFSDVIYTHAQAFGGFVAVVTARNDVSTDTILLVSSDEMSWRVVGAHMVTQSRARWFGGSPRFVAVIGADKTTNDDPLKAAADAVHIISLVPEDGTGVIVNIPRDTVMRVPYTSGWTVAELNQPADPVTGLLPDVPNDAAGTYQLNAAQAAAILAHCNGQCDKINRTMMDKSDRDTVWLSDRDPARDVGLPSGPAVTVASLELETGLDLEGYFHTGFGSAFGPPGFTDLVDTFIEAYSTVFAFTAPYAAEVTPGSVALGQTTLTGIEALTFARERKNLPLGDYDRSRGQGLLLKAAIANIQPLGIRSTPGLLGIMDNFVNTDLTPEQVLTFAATMFVVDPGPMPTLSNFDLVSLGSAAYDLNEGTLPNVLIAGCSDPVFFDDGSWSSWYVAQNWANWADLADDGTLTSTPAFACETIPGTGTGGSLWASWASLPLGKLRVTTSPAVPSQILVDGVPADSWGLNWLNMPTGSYQVSFTDVRGFATPAPQTVTVTEGNTTTVTGAFTEHGSFRVITSPAVSATISVDDKPRNNWGMWSDFAPGTYEVCFEAAADFTTPACQTASVTAGADTVITGTYTPSAGAPAPSGHGKLRVTTSPAVPSQILVDGVPADSWGLNWLNLPPGSYQVSFTDVRGFATPAPQTVTVTEGNTTTVTGAFTELGSLRVTTSPPVAATIFVDGIPRNNWGMWTDLAPGNHQVCFSGGSGFAAPACQTANVAAGIATTSTGNFS